MTFWREISTKLFECVVEVIGVESWRCVNEGAVASFTSENKPWSCFFYNCESEISFVCSNTAVNYKLVARYLLFAQERSARDEGEAFAVRNPRVFCALTRAAHRDSTTRME
jgi:hypothetical protein